MGPAHPSSSTLSATPGDGTDMAGPSDGNLDQQINKLLRHGEKPGSSVQACAVEYWIVCQLAI